MKKKKPKKLLPEPLRSAQQSTQQSNQPSDQSSDQQSVQQQSGQQSNNSGNKNPNAGKQDERLLSTDMNFNVDQMKLIFNHPVNKALHVREVYVSALNRGASILYIEGTIDLVVLEEQIVKRLQKEAPNVHAPVWDSASFLIRHVLAASDAKKVQDMNDIVKKLLDGNTIIIPEGYAWALAVESSGFEHRTVAEPQTENVLRGPREAFIESASVNRSLIRKQLRDPHLITEMITLGQQTDKLVSLVYLQHIANPDLINKVKDRIAQIESKDIMNLSMLEQHLEERPYSIFPSILLTERPDRTSAFLMEGHIAMFMENSPYSLIVPITFWSLFHTAEDHYFRWMFGNFIRLIRVIAIFVALLTPSFYIAVSTFHAEMIPTDLMLAIAAARERVPFPVFFEIIFMEIAFEILREAGIRVPTPIGPTIGIVGALILGQAAVDANIVSPILVIVVSLTGLASFAIPEISFNFTIRILRFVMLFAASIIGFFGIALVITLLTVYIVSLKSFGVPFMSPMAPYQPSSKDLVFRRPVWKEWLQPLYASPISQTRRKKPGGK